MTQETRVAREGGAWSEEVMGSLAAVKNWRVKVDVGSVNVRGGQQPGINYAIHPRSYTSSEQDARRQFDSYKINAYVRGDTAWIVADWQGGRPRKFSGEFTVNVPREMEAVKVETAGGSIDAAGVSGRLDAQSGGGRNHPGEIRGNLRARNRGGADDARPTWGGPCPPTRPPA